MGWKKMKKTSLLVGAAYAAVATPLAAQETSETVLDDSATIVVTATRSETTLQDVPADVTVRDFDTLRRDGFTYGTDEFRGVPGVSFRRGEGDGDVFPFVSIRGSTGVEGYLTLIDGLFSRAGRPAPRPSASPTSSRAKWWRAPIS